MLHCFFYKEAGDGGRGHYHGAPKGVETASCDPQGDRRNTHSEGCGGLVSLTERQIRRIVKRIREEGDGGVRHKSRGRPSHRKLSFKQRIVELYRERYPDFGPTLFTEKLQEREGITVSRETVRTWLKEDGLWQKHRTRKAHRQWRERKDHYGEMLQMDGSHHDWFEGRGPRCVLMAYIDDATGRVYGRFYDYEGTIPAMDSFKRYLTKYGLPMSVYLDKHTTYKSWARKDEFRETEPIEPIRQSLAGTERQKAPCPLSLRPREGSSGCSRPSRTGWSRRCGLRV